MKRKQINISISAYDKLKDISKGDMYRGRGITGVIDMLLFNEFKTKGSGRPVGTTGIKHKTHKSPRKVEKSVDIHNMV